MKYCSHCNVYHEDTHQSCVVCGRVLVQKEHETHLVTPGYPKVDVIKNKPHIGARVLILIGILISLIVGVVNIMTHQEKETLWSIIIITSLIYVYLLINQVIISKNDYSTKTLKQVLIVSIILVGIDFATNYQGWAISYAIPFVLAGTTAFLPIIVASMPKKYHTHVRNLFWLILLNILYTLIAFLTPLLIEGSNWTGAMTGIVGVTLFCAMLLFAPKTTYQELVKFFHI